MLDQILPIVIGAAVSLVTAWLGYKTAKRTGRAQEITAEAARVNATVEFASSASEEWQKLYQEMRVRLEQLEQRADLADARADENEARARDAEARLDAAEQRAANAEARISMSEHAAHDAEQAAAAAQQRINDVLGDFNAVFDWIDSGMKPPPPTRPHYLKELRP